MKKALFRLRAGFTLVEFLLFLGILAIMAGTVTAVFIATQEARVRQQGIALVEQRGGQLMHTLTRRIRRAETVLTPASGETGAILALQMGQSTEFPTIFTGTASGNLLMIEKTTSSQILTGSLVITNFVFRNIGNTNVMLSFDLVTTFPLPTLSTYRRHFESTVTIFPDDQSDAGGCGSCPAPVCVNHQYQWYYCASSVCTQSAQTIDC